MRIRRRALHAGASPAAHPRSAADIFPVQPGTCTRMRPGIALSISGSAAILMTISAPCSPRCAFLSPSRDLTEERTIPMGIPRRDRNVEIHIARAATICDRADAAPPPRYLRPLRALVRSPARDSRGPRVRIPRGAGRTRRTLLRRDPLSSVSGVCVGGDCVARSPLHRCGTKPQFLSRGMRPVSAEAASPVRSSPVSYGRAVDAAADFRSVLMRRRPPPHPPPARASSRPPAERRCRHPARAIRPHRGR